MAIIKRNPITYQIAFSRMLKLGKWKRYVLDWFTDMLRHGSIDPHRVEKAELVITLSPDYIEAYASEVDCYREAICTWCRTILTLLKPWIGSSGSSDGYPLFTIPGSPWGPASGSVS